MLKTAIIQVAEACPRENWGTINGYFLMKEIDFILCHMYNKNALQILQEVVYEVRKSKVF